MFLSIHISNPEFFRWGCTARFFQHLNREPEWHLLFQDLHYIFLPNGKHPETDGPFFAEKRLICSIALYVPPLTINLLVSIVDYYRVDKEDIVTADTTETAPPALPPVSQTLPSQPLDVLFIERRGDLLKFYFSLWFETSKSILDLMNCFLTLRKQ